MNRERGEIIVYTKPGCCLCDGLRDKLETALEGARAARGARERARRVTRFETLCSWPET